MGKCPNCGNADVKKRYIVGRTPETGKLYCDVCIKDRANVKVKVNLDEKTSKPQKESMNGVETDGSKL